MLLGWLAFLIPIIETINVELKKQYENYRLCIKRRENILSEANYVQVVTLAKGADVTLPCFSCVSPENAIEIESTYKPSAGSIGRAFIAAFDFFKEKILRSTNKIRDVNKWKYDWQRAIMGQDWRLLTKMHETGIRVEKIADKVKRFLARDNARIRVGDRYELRITNVDRNITGYYRCVNKHGKNRVVSSMYYLDVISRANIKMIKSKLDEIPSAVTIKEEKLSGKLKAKPVISPWSECSKCGEEIGEQARSIQCMIEPDGPLSHLPPASTWIHLFGTVPCYSTLVPLEQRRQFASSTTFVQYRPCWRACTTQLAVDRNLTSVDELGETRLLDYIPKGEFLFGEILPRLLAPVVRRNYLAIEGDPVIFTCELPVDDPTGVQWFSKRKGAIQFKTIEKQFKGRFLFDELSRLYITKLEMEDSDEYFCYTSEKVLMGVHYLRVLENDRTREYVANIEMFFRFAAFTFIFVLMIGQVMK
uniref:Ig-like domain-containing protein n=1 Tax=Haemonchus contortus TaxID=6289 RepID=A0A7I5EBP2_HAECO